MIHWDTVSLYLRKLIHLLRCWQKVFKPSEMRESLLHPSMFQYYCFLCNALFYAKHLLVFIYNKSWRERKDVRRAIEVGHQRSKYAHPFFDFFLLDNPVNVKLVILTMCCWFSGEMLEERQLDAVCLQFKCNKVSSMTAEDVAELRNEIKVPWNSCLWKKDLEIGVWIFIHFFSILLAKDASMKILVKRRVSHEMKRKC